MDRCLVCYNLWGCKESDATEHTHKSLGAKDERLPKGRWQVFVHFCFCFCNLWQIIALSLSVVLILIFFNLFIKLAPQAPLSMEFCRQEYWNGLPFPSSRDLREPQIESAAPESCIYLQADSLLLKPPGNDL